MYHYVYRLDHLETNEFYIGSRTSKVHPSLDPYMGSMHTWKPDKNKLKKTILRDDFLDRESAILFEADEIAKVIDEDLNRNYHIPPKKYHTVGMIVVTNTSGKNFLVGVNDPRFISGELKSVTAGFFITKDEFGNRFYIKKDDPRYLSGELISYNKGTLAVNDKDGNILRVAVNDPRYLSGELVHIWLGKKHSSETIEKVKETFKRIEHQQGKNNSQWGTCWINKDNINKKIKKDELDVYISDNWLKGRICKIKLNNWPLV